MSKKPQKELMSLQEATEYLKKIDEWYSARKFDRDTIIKWASFLKEREAKTSTRSKQLTSHC